MGSPGGADLPGHELCPQDVSSWGPCSCPHPSCFVVFPALPPSWDSPGCSCALHSGAPIPRLACPGPGLTPASPHSRPPRIAGKDLVWTLGLCRWNRVKRRVLGGPWHPVMGVLMRTEIWKQRYGAGEMHLEFGSPNTASSQRRWKRQSRVLLGSLLGEHGPARTLISGFWAQNCETSSFCSVPTFHSGVTAAPGHSSKTPSLGWAPAR